MRMRGLCKERSGALSASASGCLNASPRIFGSLGSTLDNALAFLVDDDFTVILCERADVGVRQDIEYGL